MFDLKKPVVLIYVFKTHTKDLSSYFLDYDTKYFSFSKGGKPLFKDIKTFDHYKLKSMPCLVLLFTDGNFLFSTIRSYNEQKEKYYRSKLNQFFKIVFPKEDKKK